MIGTSNAFTGHTPSNGCHIESFLFNLTVGLKKAIKSAQVGPKKQPQSGFQVMTLTLRPKRPTSRRDCKGSRPLITQPPWQRVKGGRVYAGTYQSNLKPKQSICRRRSKSQTPGAKKQSSTLRLKMIVFIHGNLLLVDRGHGWQVQQIPLKAWFNVSTMPIQFPPLVCQ